MKSGIKAFWLLLAAALLGAGCASYHVGTALPPEQRCVFVETVANETTEAILGTLTRQALQERFSQTPGLRLAASDGTDAGLKVEVTLVALEQRNLARARTREKKARRDDGDAYQTVLYRLDLHAKWRAIPAQGDEAAIRKGEIVATADMPLTADKETAQRSALRQVARDLAVRIADAIAD